MSRVLGPVVTKERTRWLSAIWEGPESLKNEHTEGQGKGLDGASSVNKGTEGSVVWRFGLAAAYAGRAETRAKVENPMGPAENLRATPPAVP